MAHEVRGTEPVVQIGTAEDQAEADLWKAILDAEGIPCLVRNQNPIAYYQATIPFMQFALDVYVPRSAVKQARAILAPSLKPRQGRAFSPATKRLAWGWLLLGPIAGLPGLVVFLIYQAFR